MNDCCAAQYIRMSTDKQDLSPSLQKDAIAAYAAAHGLQIVASYEDEGRSGVHLKNRPALLRLLADVSGPTQFSTVLVYDVSRWGRFQDTDAAAYYEYHCRLHGAAIVYVAELFGSEVNPVTAMLKSMKRAMAAEYSRDLAAKCRAGQHQVVTRGFQIGALPPLGYRRCSVSADGSKRTLLEIGQRKLAFTDRIEWVLASAEEVTLVRRICDLYARRGFSFVDIARLSLTEGWRNGRGHLLSQRGIATLLTNEALIGNFVWGRRKLAKSIVHAPPSRRDGSVPRIIDDETWALIRRRTDVENVRTMTDEQISTKVKRVLDNNPMVAPREFRAHRLPSFVTVCQRLGGWSGYLKQHGLDPDEINRTIALRGQQRRNAGFNFGSALASRLRSCGLPVTYNGRERLLHLPGMWTMRPRLLWPVSGADGRAWLMRIERGIEPADFDLVVRMNDAHQPMDYFVAPAVDVAFRFPRLVSENVSGDLERYWCKTDDSMLHRIAAIHEWADGSAA